jgi:spore germination protein GerM
MKPTLLIGALLLALVGVACGVPADSSPQLLAESALPAELTDPGTTTTTTEPPSFSVDQPVYFLDETDLLAEVAREVPSPVDSREVLEVLFLGPTEEESDLESLRTAIPLETEILELEQTGDVLTIDLAAGSLEEIEGALQEVAIAQIVYTATAIDGINGVLIKIDGEFRQLPTDEGDSQEDEPVGRADYRSLDPRFAELEDN